MKPALGCWKRSKLGSIRRQCDSELENPQIRPHFVDSPLLGPYYGRVPLLPPSSGEPDFEVISVQCIGLMTLFSGSPWTEPIRGIVACSRVHNVAFYLAVLCQRNDNRLKNLRSGRLERRYELHGAGARRDREIHLGPIKSF